MGKLTSDTIVRSTKAKAYGAGVTGIARMAGQCRALWNLFLGENIERYETERRFVFYREMSLRLPDLLRTDARLSGLSHRAAQMTVIKLDRALQACSKKAGLTRTGFPRFKRRNDNADGFAIVGKEVRVERGRVRLPKIGWVRVRGLVDTGGQRIAQVIVRQEPRGWHLCVQFESQVQLFPEPALTAVGVDVGVANLATMSDGGSIAHPRIGRLAAKRIRRLNRERDRRRKGSVNRRRAVQRLARAHRGVANARRDAMHKATTRLVNTYAGFAVEDLSLRGLTRTRLAGSLADAGLGEFLRTLHYKAEWAGRSWLVYPRFKRSTGVCPDCNHIGEKLGLSIREWTCTNCGAAHHRDVAAARVILSGAVPPERREPARTNSWRKRGAAVGDGAQTKVGASRGGSPTNVHVANNAPVNDLGTGSGAKP